MAFRHLRGSTTVALDEVPIPRFGSPRWRGPWAPLRRAKYSVLSPSPEPHLQAAAAQIMASPKPPSLDVPAFLTREQVSEILRCSEDTVDRRIRAGKLKAVKDDRLVRISVADLNAYIKASKRWL